MYPCSSITSERILHAFIPSMWAVLILYFGTGVHETQGSGLLLSFERVSHVTLAKSLCCIWTSLWTSSCGMLNERSNPWVSSEQKTELGQDVEAGGSQSQPVLKQPKSEENKNPQRTDPTTILQNPLISSGYWAHTHVLMFVENMRCMYICVHLLCGYTCPCTYAYKPLHVCPHSCVSASSSPCWDWTLLRKCKLVSCGNKTETVPGLEENTDCPLG